MKAVTLVAAILSLVTFASSSRAIVAGKPDAIREYAHVTVLRIAFKDGHSEWCTASVIDAHRAITAAHCVLGGSGRALPIYGAATKAIVASGRSYSATSAAGISNISMSASRGSTGRVYATAVYVNPDYLRLLKSGANFTQASPYDVAIIETGDAIRSFITATYIDTPQTALARQKSSSLHGEKVGSLDERKIAAVTVQSATDQLSSVLKKMNNSDHVVGMVSGFGCTTRLGGCHDLSSLPINYLDFDARLGSYINNRCSLSVSGTKALASANSCYFPVHNSAGLSSNAQVGDSGGPVTVDSEAGMPAWFGNLEQGAPQELVALTSWGEGATVSINTNLIPNTNFIRMALLRDPGLKPISLPRIAAIKQRPLITYSLIDYRGISFNNLKFMTLAIGDGTIALKSDDCALYFIEETSIGFPIHTADRELDHWSTCLGDFGPHSGWVLPILGDLVTGGTLERVSPNDVALVKSGKRVAVFERDVAQSSSNEEPTAEESAEDKALAAWWPIEYVYHVDRESTPKVDLPIVSIGAVYLFWEVWSERLGEGEGPTGLDSLAGIYANKIEYYGKLTTNRQAMADKYRYRERWPNRFYQIVPGSLKVGCGARSCNVSGEAKWAVSSPKDGRTANGLMDFSFVVSEAGRILSESSHVVG